MTLRVGSHGGDCWTSTSQGRQCASLQELLRCGSPGDPRAALDEFDVLSVALVQQGITDDALKTHLVLHASRLSNFQLVREEVRSALITRPALGQGPTPLDIGALDAKGKGKGKGKGKNKDKGKAEDKPDAHYCSKVAHRKADSWSWQAAQKDKDRDRDRDKDKDKDKDKS